MSNNVMWLENKRLDIKIPIAKYYPGTGWYITQFVTLDEIDKAFDKDVVRTIGGPTDWEITYDEK